MPVLWFVLWGAVALLIGYLWRKYIGERTLKAAERRAKEIIQEAENAALSKKREIDIESKEMVYRLRNEFERETRNKRREIQFQEKRLQQREFNLERKSEVLEKKDEEIGEREKQIGVRENDLKQRETDYEALLEEEKKKLERISGYTRDEAKSQLLKTMEDEARRDAVKIQKRIEDEARETGEKKAREILLVAMQKMGPDEAS